MTNLQNSDAQKSLTLTGGGKARTPPLLSEIYRVLKMGGAVLPVVDGGKKPAIAEGYKAATKDRAAIEAYFRAKPWLNYGVATGERSGFFALDIDGPEGRATLAALVAKHGPLPKTIKEMTPHGVHYCFKTPSFRIPNSAGSLGKGIDIRADGGYVVGPGSRTPDGVYTFALGRGPEDVRTASAPAWLLELVGSKSAPTEGASGPLRKLSADQLARAKRYAEGAFLSELDRLRKAPVHQRNHTLNISTFKSERFVALGLLDRARITAELTQVAKAIGLEDAEIPRSIESGLKAGLKNPARLPFIKTASAGDEDSLPSKPDDELTKELAQLGEDDIANAERFARRFGHIVIYCETRGYLVFDGKRYQPDAKLLRVTRLGEEVVTKIGHELPYLGGEDARTSRAKFARASRSKGAIDRMLDLAKGRLVVDDRAIDADPWLLNTLTCTIDLRTGQYQPHDARDLLTKIAAVEAKPNSKCPVFDKLIERITGGNTELARYVQKAVGYTLTGIASAQVLFFVHGKSGSNGKSTLVNLIREMLGDYGAHTPTETLLTKNYENAIPVDLARLQGKRMVAAIEANVNRQLDEAKIKGMTGGEPITARLLYQNPSEYTPQFKLWFVANDRPHVRATDNAIWRRIRVIPLNLKFQRMRSIPTCRTN